MPIYEYLCGSCGKVNEAFQKVNDPPPARCDGCGGKRLSKLVSRSAFQLKGGGWYSDRYSSARSEPPAAADGAAASGVAGAASPAPPPPGAGASAPQAPSGGAPDAKAGPPSKRGKRRGPSSAP